MVSTLHPSAFNRVLLVLVALLMHVITLDAACFCGISQTSKIVGGVNAQLNEFPWQASFYHKLHFIFDSVGFCFTDIYISYDGIEQIN
jgi:hypothetical protein